MTNGITLEGLSQQQAEYLLKTAKKNETHLLFLNDMIMKARLDIVCFKFQKKDGSIRTAYGTLLSKIISRYIQPDPSKDEDLKKKSKNPALVTYFDLERQDWRSFRSDNFISIDDDYSI